MRNAGGALDSVVLAACVVDLLLAALTKFAGDIPAVRALVRMAPDFFERNEIVAGVIVIPGLLFWLAQ